MGALISRLSDTVEEVVVEAAGALRFIVTILFDSNPLLTLRDRFRNLCIDGGYDICAEMYNKNILTPLKTFIPKVRASYFILMSPYSKHVFEISNLLGQFISDPSAAPSNTHVLVCDFAENVITILWCLSSVSLHCINYPPLTLIPRETSNKALNAINNMGLVPFLVAFLESRSKLPAHTVTAAGLLQWHPIMTVFIHNYQHSASTYSLMKTTWPYKSFALNRPL